MKNSLVLKLVQPGGAVFTSLVPEQFVNPNNV